MRIPSSHKKSIPSLLMAPIVSAAIGTNKYDWHSEEYLFLFLSAAASDAAPGVWDVSCTYTEPVCRSLWRPTCRTFLVSLLLLIHHIHCHFNSSLTFPLQTIFTHPRIPFLPFLPYSLSSRSACGLPLSRVLWWHKSDFMTRKKLHYTVGISWKQHLSYYCRLSINMFSTNE